MRLTVIQCPSVGDYSELFHEPCTSKACSWWRSNECGAAVDTEESYGAFLDKYPDPGECKLAEACRWHVQALSHGQTRCLVRRLGEICEHQGGDWNTFAMASPEEWAEAEAQDV